MLPFERVQSLASLKGQTQAIYVYLDKPEEYKAVTKKIAALNHQEDIFIRELASHTFMAMMKMAETIYAIVYGVFIIVASFLIVNTVIMVIHERIKEIGMMGALGMSRFEIIMVFFLEAILLSFFGSIAGTFIGGVLSLILSYVPIDILAMTGGVEFPVANTIFIKFSPFYLLYGFLFGVVISSCCTIFPSLKSAFIEPVEALRR